MWRFVIGSDSIRHSVRNQAELIHWFIDRSSTMTLNQVHKWVIIGANWWVRIMGGYTYDLCGSPTEQMKWTGWNMTYITDKNAKELFLKPYFNKDKHISLLYFWQMYLIEIYNLMYIHIYIYHSNHMPFLYKMAENNKWNFEIVWVFMIYIVPPNTLHNIYLFFKSQLTSQKTLNCFKSNYT